VVISALSQFVSQKTSLSYGQLLGLVMLLLVALIGGMIWGLSPDSILYETSILYYPSNRTSGPAIRRIHA
jgi:hypothetical protein